MRFRKRHGRRPQTESRFTAADRPCRPADSVSAGLLRAFVHQYCTSCAGAGGWAMARFWRDWPDKLLPPGSKIEARREQQRLRRPTPARLSWQGVPRALRARAAGPPKPRSAGSRLARKSANDYCLSSAISSVSLGGRARQSTLNGFPALTWAQREARDYAPPGIRARVRGPVRSVHGSVGRGSTGSATQRSRRGSLSDLAQARRLGPR
jgi:hypothetical protein